MAGLDGDIGGAGYIIAMAGIVGKVGIGKAFNFIACLIGGNQANRKGGIMAIIATGAIAGDG